MRIGRSDDEENNDSIIYISRNDSSPRREQMNRLFIANTINKYINNIQVII